MVLITYFPNNSLSIHQTIVSPYRQKKLEVPGKAAPDKEAIIDDMEMEIRPEEGTRFHIRQSKYLLLLSLLKQLRISIFCFEDECNIHV